jgi:hypothetical protein
MTSSFSRGLKVSDLARWEWCNEESFLRCHGVERSVTIHDQAGTAVHKKVVRPPDHPWEKDFFEKLNKHRPFFREVHGVKIFGGVDAIEGQGLREGIVRFVECKTRGERSVPPFLIKPAMFQLQIYAWLFQPIVAKTGFQLADVHYVDFIHRESMEIINRYPCVMDHEMIDQKVKQIVASLLENKYIHGALETEPWKCKNCAVEYKEKCRFQRNIS